MSRMSAIDRLWASAVGVERERIQVALTTHLRNVHGWNTEAIHSLVAELRLDEKPTASQHKPHCPVCNDPIGQTTDYYGTNLHETCADSLDDVINQMIKEN